MEKSIRIFFIFLFISIISVGNAQSISYSGPIPFKPMSPLFGKDIIINDIPTENQKNVSICSAFNGWLFAAYWVKNVGSTSGSMQLNMMKSEDNGIHWNLLRTFPVGSPSEIFTSFKIVSCGDSLSNLKLFLGLILYDTLNINGTAIVTRFNGITGLTETEILNDQFVDAHCLDIATDFNFPASNSSPGSLAILYSKRQGPIDSLVFRSSSDGGMTLNNHKMVAVSTDQYYFNRVTLNYGRCSTYSEGNYFAAWELIDNNGLNFNHIYTAHSIQEITGAFTSPVCLDCLDSTIISKCENPVICCQFGNFDNDSSNVSEIVLVEKIGTSNINKDIIGFYNLHAETSNHFNKFTIVSSIHNEIQPSANFNPFDSKFMFTYYDSTLQSLPFLTHDVNMTNPDSWNIITNAYNDNGNLVSPNPKVNLNFAQQSGMNAWISKGTNGNGVAMFDAPYSTYTGVTENIFSRKEGFSVYPNPCKSNIIIDFELQKASNVTIAIYNLIGQEVGMITNQDYSSGKHELKCSVNLLPGSYLCSYKTDDFLTTQKLMVIR